jgi:hypothetical protein
MSVARERHIVLVEELDQLGKVRQRACQAVDLVDHDDINLAGPHIIKERCRAGRSVLPPEKPPSTILEHCHPVHLPIPLASQHSADWTSDLASR